MFKKSWLAIMESEKKEEEEEEGEREGQEENLVSCVSR